jgi:histidyl-tRNA synthetase
MVVDGLQSPWEEVRREMTDEKGLDPEVADKIGAYVNFKGGRDLLTKLTEDPTLYENPSAKKGLDDMATLFDYLEVFGVLPNISLDMSLARGLDYYTGVIYEVITEGSAGDSTKKPKKGKKPADADEDRSSDPSVGVGSVAAGGRYDELVGMFSGKGQIPCVGISFGLDRIFSITKARMAKETVLRPNEVDVYVMVLGSKTGMLKERMEVATQLWDAGIKAEFSWKVNPRFQNQFKAAENGGVPYAVFLGENEAKEGKVKLKKLGLPDGHPEKDGVIVAQAELVVEVRRRLKADAEPELEQKVAELTVQEGS